MNKGLKITLIILGVLVGIALIVGICFIFKDNNIESENPDLLIKTKEVKLGLITNELTNTISIGSEEAKFISDLFNKYEYTTETCDGVADFNLIIDGITYGIEVYENEVHITTAGKEMVLNEEDSIKVINIINKYVPDKFKPIIECIKAQLGGLITNLNAITEKDINSLISIDKEKIAYSYMAVNNNDDFYLILKTDDKNTKDKIKDYIAKNYKGYKTTTYDNYIIYVYNGADDFSIDQYLKLCSY